MWRSHERHRGRPARRIQGPLAARQACGCTRRLNEQIADLDAAVENWWRLPLSAHQNNAVIPRVDASGYTIAEEPRPAEECICGNHSAQSRVARNDADALDIICALRSQGPLGRLHRLDEHIDMDPRVQDGYPVVRGRRIETEMLHTLYEWGSAADELADRFALTREQVEAAIAFEQALAS